MAEFDKLQLRRSLLKQRQSLDKTLWQEMSHNICKKIANTDLFQQAKTILAYSSFRQEPDLTFLLENYNSVNSSYKWGLPRCIGESLSWHSCESISSLSRGSFGILEPTAEVPQIDPRSVDLILVPAVAIDLQGYRLGYGGGFYDRMLVEPQWQNIPTMGIIFDFACLEALPIETWDIPLTAICTEARYRVL